MSDLVPARLREAVRDDFRPVRPLAAPWRRTIMLAPAGFLFALLSPLFWGLRQNLAALPPSLSWGLSFAQVLIGLVVVGAALREAVPGRTLSGRALAVVVGGAIALEVAITLYTAVRVPTVVPPGAWARFAWECWFMAGLSGAPVLLAAAWLAGRALPARPWLAGAVYGLGAGLIADSGTRLFCWVSEPAHVLVAHGGSILSLAVLGGLTAAVIERTRARTLWPK
ncbi:MAG TPA: NrsF family protein [Vicinamibacteria bacterium]|nr:NrsF family protein [Vicinamibacteria bacterium]